MGSLWVPYGAFGQEFVVFLRPKLFYYLRMRSFCWSMVCSLYSWSAACSVIALVLWISSFWKIFWVWKDSVFGLVLL